MKAISLILSLCILCMSSAGWLELRAAETQTEVSCCCQAEPVSCCDHEEDENTPEEKSCGPECDCYDMLQVQALMADATQDVSPLYRVLSYPVETQDYHLDLVRLLLQPPRFA